MTLNTMATADSTVAVNGIAIISPSPPLSSRALDFHRNLDFIMTELGMLFGVISITYLGAHASLYCHPRARASKSKDEKRDDGKPPAQGMYLSFAILSTAMVIILGGLYYPFRELEHLLCYGINALFIGSYVDVLDHIKFLFFPEHWRGADGIIRKVNGKRRTVAVCDDLGSALSAQPPPTSQCPLPGALAVRIRSEKLRKAVWSTRDLVTKDWSIKILIDDIVQKAIHVRFTQMMALLAFMGMSSLFSSSCLIILTTCYTYSVMPPNTNFLWASLRSCAPFFCSVFTLSLTPLKLTLTTPSGASFSYTIPVCQEGLLLGFNHALAGCLIAWSLNFDLWLDYLNKIKPQPMEVCGKETDSRKHGEVYMNAEKKSFLSPPPQRPRKEFLLLPVEIAASGFDKTYFHAAMAGCGLDMAFKMAMRIVFGRRHATLLYLVPAVVGTLLITSLVRGEFHELWTYTGDGSPDVWCQPLHLDKQDTHVMEAQRKRRETEEGAEGEEGEEGEEEEKSGDSTKETDSKDQEVENGGEKKSYKIFSQSLEVPAEDRGQNEP